MYQVLFKTRQNCSR